MGLEALAAGLVVTVKDRTGRGIAAIGRGFEHVKRKGAQFGSVMQSLTPIAGQLAGAGLGLAITLGIGAKKAIDFEKQLSAVLAVTSVAGQKDFPALTKEIKRLGATTQFSATEAAAGAENLTRAGFNTTEVIQGLSGALNAAAADGIDMAISARLIANSVRSFGLEAKDASHVADVLANTSAKSNTNMIELGEALKFTAPIARELGVSIEDASAALGVLADAGLQGSVGGTALKNMFLKLAKPSAEGAKLMKKYGFAAKVDAATGNVDVAATMDLLAEKLKGIPSKLERVAVAQELFGIRGQAAAGNFVAVIEKSGTSLSKRFAEIQADTAGAAKRMADLRLDNVAGSFTLLGSAIEGLAIEVFSDQMGTAKTTIRFFADALSVVVEALQQMKEGFVIDTEGMTKFREKFGPMTDTLVDFAYGVREGLDMIHNGIAKLTEFGKTISGVFGPSGDMAKALGTAAVIAVPVIIVLGLLGAAALAIAIPLVTMGSAIGSVLAFLGVGLAGVLVGFGLFAGTVNATKKEGETFGQAMIGTFGTIKDFVMDFAKGFVEGYEDYIKPTYSVLVEAGNEMMLALQPIFDVIGEMFGGMGDDGLSMGQTIAQVIGGIAKVFAFLVKNVVAPVIKFFANNFVVGILSGIGDIFRGFQGLLSGTQSIGDGLIQIFTGVAKLIANTFLVPIRGALDLAIQAAEAFGLGDSEVIVKAKSALDVLRFKDGPTKIGATEKRAVDVKGFGLAAPEVAKVKTAKQPDVNVIAKPGDQKVEIKNNLVVDGRNMAAATGKVEIENLERLGGMQTPFFNRAVRGGGVSSPSGR